MAYEDLDAAFILPDVITDVRLRGLYEVLVHRLRHEARDLPMNTVQQLLIERIAYNYVVLRAREAGELGGFGSATVQKDFNTFWLSMTQEFNRLLGKGEPMTAVQRRAMLNEVKQIIVTTLSVSIQDPRLRSDLMERMANAFDTAGI